MLKKLRLCHNKMPDVYVADTKEDIRQAKELGIPYIVRPADTSDEILTIAIMIPVMKKLLPYIDWMKWYRERTGVKFSEVRNIIIEVPGGEHEADDILQIIGEDSDEQISDIAREDRSFNCQFSRREVKRNLDKWLTDENSSVDIDYLMSMELMPAFCLDVTKAIEKNLIGYDWSDGYNKKLGMIVGNYDSQKRNRNLLIIDVSSSIPRHISATMITLADTLRNKMNAELIITGSNSMYWGLEDELPSPKWIRNNIGYANESYEFADILGELAGSEFANVICFGDYDTPYPPAIDEVMSGRSPIIVHNLLSFHTTSQHTPGYVAWLKQVNVERPDFYERIDTEWADIIME